VNFTREPIIETIISPKEGHKLLVRSSRGGSDAEEFYVDAVEVVSFGKGYFFRSLERPKAFLVPVSDYEVLEVKEARVALKNVSHERNIKIGGGREASLRHAQREHAHEKEREAEAVAEEQEYPSPVAEETHLEPAPPTRMEKRRDRRRRRHRRSSEDQEWNERRSQERQEPQETEAKAQGSGPEEEAKVSSQMFSSLIPPPPTLISETLSRYKDKEFFEGPKEERKHKEKEKEKENPPEQESSGSESSPLNRVVNSPENLEVSSTNFSSLLINNELYFF
jgi:hypothetical protein